MNTFEKVATMVFGTIGVIVTVVGIGLLLAFPIKWTWNAVMPCLFGLPSITWGKAWCLHFLASVFIKSSQFKSSK